jgi:hypothetical protein
MVGFGTAVVLVVLVDVVVDVVEVVEVVDVVELVDEVVLVEVAPGVVVDVVVVVGRVGNGAIVTCSPRRILTYSPTVISGSHVPCRQTST